MSALLRSLIELMFASTYHGGFRWEELKREESSIFRQGRNLVRDLLHYRRGTAGALNCCSRCKQVDDARWSVFPLVNIVRAPPEPPSLGLGVLSFYHAQIHQSAIDV